MELKISKEEMMGKKLMVCSPLYGGMCHGAYMQSMLQLQGLCQRYGIQLTVNIIMNESLIQRARTYLTDGFMQSDSTHLLFVDADIGFNAQDVIFMLGLQTPDSQYDIISGVYPKKTLSFEKIKQAVDAGVADKDPNVLENFVGDFVFNPIALPPGSDGRIRLDEPLEVAETGTGFMMLTREALQRWEKANPDRKYLPDHVRTKNFDGSREVYEYFTVKVDPVTRRLLSEDYQLCHEFRAAGMKVWVCPWMHLTHFGTMAFGGSLPMMLNLGIAPTADPSKLGTKK